MKITVVGGSNIDIIGSAINSYKEADSNLGKIKISFGGVGRNIVENLARLGAEVTFITAIGSDDLGKKMKSELEELGVKVISPTSNYPSSYYMAICDNKGEMVSAINDMEIIKLLSLDYLKENEKYFDSDYLIIDTNLEEETIKYITEKYKDKKIICDGISAAKVVKVKKFLSNLYLLKVNGLEYEALGLEDIPCNLVITKGKENVILKESNKTFSIPVIKKDKIIGATGAGDAMVAGITYSLLNGKTLYDSVCFGIKASSITLDVNESVNKNIASIK